MALSGPVPPCYGSAKRKTGRLVTDDVPYEQVTEGIRIRVTPEFSEDQSTPDESYYLWVYTIEIANESERTVQLKSRVWRITDARGKTDEVRGPGVVGQTPVIPPGQSFTYSSGCPLSTPSGIMVGSYQMTDESGQLFDVAIPAFSLDSPYTTRSVN
jgi:ApaG protein